MKLQEIYEQAIALGIKNDPRSKSVITKILEKAKKEQKKLTGEEKKWFDTERLTNPYGDTRILWGDKKKDIKKIAVGVDIEVSDLLLIDRLNENGANIDLALSHHPEGAGLQYLSSVMSLQVDIFESLGVPPNIGEKTLESRITKIDQSLHSANLYRSQRAAELLQLPYACFHTVADNHVWKFLTKKICEKKWDSLQDIVDELNKIPEYNVACQQGVGPKIVVGSKNSRPGKVAATGMTGGTNGDEKIVAKLSIAGVGTILSMHEGEKHLEEYKKHDMNVIVCSHIASDSIGLNLLLDEIESEKIEILPMSGFIRYNRKTKKFS